MADSAPSLGNTFLFSSPYQYFTPHRKGKRLTSSEQQLLLNVYSYMRERYPESNAHDVVMETAKMCGVGHNSLSTARQTIKNGRVLRTPQRKRNSRGKKPHNLVVDDFMKCAIRQKVHGMFLENKIVTLKNLKEILDAEGSLPKISKSTLYETLKTLGFKYEKRGKKSILIERDDIIVWRHRYLRQIFEYHRQNRNLIYLDETWVNAGHTTGKVWKDGTVHSSRQAFIEGVTTGNKDPTGKGGRLIVVNACTHEGFVPGANLVFVAKKGEGDYHQEMDGSRFKKWFTEQLLENIPENSIIIMDNASYHSMQVDPAPNKSSTKSKMQEWLARKNVPWGTDMLKKELYALVLEHKDNSKSYVIDNIAFENGHTVFRMPPYHSDLNPIELIWARIKHNVAISNTTFKMKDLLPLYNQAVADVGESTFRHSFRHILDIESKLWELDYMQDEEQQPFIINVSVDSESDEDLGVAPLE